MLKKTSLIFTALLLAGCAQNANVTTPQTQKMQVEKVDKALQKGEADRYLCQDDKVVRVVHATHKNTKKFALCYRHFSRRIRKTNLNDF